MKYDCKDCVTSTGGICAGHMRDESQVAGEILRDCPFTACKGKELQKENILLAKLAADEPMFDNPFYAIRAKEIRDRILLEDRD